MSEPEYARRSPTHPMTNPALAVELTMREREAWMTRNDWEEQVDIVLSKPAQGLSDGVSW